MDDSKRAGAVEFVFAEFNNRNFLPDTKVASANTSAINCKTCMRAPLLANSSSWQESGVIQRGYEGVEGCGGCPESP